MTEEDANKTKVEDYPPALEITAPGFFRCNVYRYHSGLSKLYIRVFKGMTESPSFYLLFSDVGYFSGPMNWKGADLRVGPAEDSIRFMEANGLVEDFDLDDPDTRLALAEAAHLYVFRTPQTNIQLIAGSVARLQDVPAEIS